jgi:hypothetical protein
MPTIADLEPLITEPREDLGAEYKDWLDLTNNEHRAVLAKAAIALVNHGGGFIVMGFADGTGGLASGPRPERVPEVTQDAVNAAIRRYASPEFHGEMYLVPHPTSGVRHPVIALPGVGTEPVMSKRDCTGVIAQGRCYIRKPGPRSEEPQTPEEWRGLVNRCVRAGRNDMLEAIRAIVTGRVDPRQVPADVRALLTAFCDASRGRWEAITTHEAIDAPPRFPHGFYEMGFSLVGARPAAGLAELHERLRLARRIRHTGWTPFLEMTTPEWAPYPFENFVEAWVGRSVANRPARTAPHSDFWRASADGQLYTIRGYSEDDLETQAPGTVFDITMPVWRVGEAILFASRLAESFDDVEAIAIRTRFTGLNDRGLTHVMGTRLIVGNHISRSNEIVLEGTVTLAQVQDNLAEIVHGLLAPLYERFDFFQLPMTLVEEELARMTRNRF